MKIVQILDWIFGIKGTKESIVYHNYLKPHHGGGIPNSTDIPWRVPHLCWSYGWPTGLAGGGKIAIVELGGGWTWNDMGRFFGSLGQPMPHIVDVSVDGTTNNQDPTDPNSGEVVLDIQVAACSYYIATGKPANIRVYWANNTSMDSIASAVTAAMKDGCDVCSISWGSDEANWGAEAAQQLDAACAAAVAAGMIVFAAAGDNDSSDGGPTPANVDLPASSPHVVGCGGTNRPHMSTPQNPETVWNNNPGNTDGSGTGGGYSTLFPIQSWQVGAPVPIKVANGRMVPDVAANADPNTGYHIILDGQDVVVGGTSAVAPLYAGLFASFGTKLGFVNEKLWANPGCFYDITSGNNGEFAAAVGSDPCTGLGTPRAAKLAHLFG